MGGWYLAAGPREGCCGHSEHHQHGTPRHPAGREERERERERERRAHKPGTKHTLMAKLLLLLLLLLLGTAAGVRVAGLSLFPAKFAKAANWAAIAAAARSAAAARPDVIVTPEGALVGGGEGDDADNRAWGAHMNVFEGALVGGSFCKRKR